MPNDFTKLGHHSNQCHLPAFIPSAPSCCTSGKKELSSGRSDVLSRGIFPPAIGLREFPVQGLDIDDVNGRILPCASANTSVIRAPPVV
jgi:hypothetical protein